MTQNDVNGVNLRDFPEIMTLEEVAQYLRTSERTVYTWANEGRLPAGKIGTAWRFRRDEIARWVEQQLPSGKRPSVEINGFQDVVVRDQVLVMDHACKDDALNAMIDSLARTPFVKDRGVLAEGIFHRERLMSTGIGMQIGVPHVRLARITDVAMAVAMNRRDLKDYESLDNQPVRLLFMIIAREDQHAQHLKILASLSARLKNDVFRLALLQAEDEDSLYNLLKAR